MMERIQDSKKFKDDYKRLQERIRAVSDVNLQRNLTETLLELRENIVYLDRHHEQMFISHRLPADVAETRANISRCRKSLEDRLSTWESKQPRS